MVSEDRRQRFYGRRTGRRLRPARRVLLKDLLPQIELPADRPAPFDPRQLFAEAKDDIWLEIGFGAGEHLLWQAAAHPAVGFIGAEPYVNGVASLLAGIDLQALTNIRVLPDDVRPLLEELAPGCLGRAFILFPDPWPKRRHHERRFISWPHLDRLAALLRPGAELRVATDDPDYLTWILRHLLDHPAFRWTARNRHDWEVRPADWPLTRYESKSIAAGRQPAFLRFERMG